MEGGCGWCRGRERWVHVVRAGGLLLCTVACGGGRGIGSKRGLIEGFVPSLRDLLWLWVGSILELLFVKKGQERELKLGWGES